MYNPSLAMYCHANKVLSKNGIVVTMAGDMGDELLGGYTKYWSLREGKWGQIKSHSDLIGAWMKRIKRPVQLDNNTITTDDIHKELMTLYPEQLFNPDDVVNSYMALDCVTQVPEEFFNRNDKYGMAYSMEGRFPLATKRFMSYSLNISSVHKIGADKSQTKLLTKKAYRGILHDAIINKSKTGWTTPLAYWMFTNKDPQLLKMYQNSDHNSNIKNANQKTAKSIIPAWIMRDWAKEYKMFL